MSILIISNPNSGGFNEERLDECAGILRRRYGSVETEYTKEPGDATNIAATAPHDLVVAAGGDGLLNETAAGLQGRRALFSALPMGTINVFCREHRIPLNPLKAAELLDLSRVKTLPMGFLGNRPFLLMCGFGYDARVVQNVGDMEKTSIERLTQIDIPKKAKKTAKHLLEGARALNEKYHELAVFANGRRYRAYHVVISLGHYYAGNFPISKNIVDDKLNIFIHQSPKPKSLFFSIMSVVVGRGLPMPPLFAESVKVSGASFGQIDGEFVETGTNHNYIRIKKDGIKMAF